MTPIGQDDDGRPISRRCTGHITRGPEAGRRCRRSASHGTNVCTSHGAAAPQVKRKAAERLAADGARAAALKYAAPVRTTDAQALRDELERSAGIVCWLTARVQALDEASLTFGMEKQVTKVSGGGPGQQGTPQIERTLAARPHVFVTMLERERHHLADVATRMAQLGIETRLVRMAEREGAQIVSLLEAHARALGHDPAALDVQAAGARALSLVTADG